VSPDDFVGSDDIPSDFFEMGIVETAPDHGLCMKADLNELHFVLKVIRRLTSEGKPASRKSVAEIAVLERPHLSEDKIRRRADILQEAGFIVKGVGRGGMRLTPEGSKYLDTV
jgi:hypothetical protein